MIQTQDLDYILWSIIQKLLTYDILNCSLHILFVHWGIRTILSIFIWTYNIKSLILKSNHYRKALIFPYTKTNRKIWNAEKNKNIENMEDKFLFPTYSYSKHWSTLSYILIFWYIVRLKYVAGKNSRICCPPPPSELSEICIHPAPSQCSC